MFYFFAPYFDLLCFLPSTHARSYTHLTIWYFTPGRSLILHPLTSTTLCSWILCFSPGIYAITSCPLESFTLAIFLWAELGFLGVCTVTLRHTPLLKGAGWATEIFLFSVFLVYWSAGDLDFLTFCFLPFFTSWLIVGIEKICVCG